MGATTLTHTWFGAPEQSLFGALHRPASGGVRGAVVVCPPVGKEQGDTTRGQRLLAERLAERGLAALRYDHLHTGESWGRQSDPEAGADLVGGLAQAVDLVRRAGAQEVAVVGLRMGALVAAQLDAQTLGTLSALVLWDPVLKGSSWLRAERSLYKIAFDDAPEVDDLVHLVGASWHTDAVTHLAGLAVGPDLVGRCAGPVAVATADPTAPGVTRLAAAGATVLPIDDQAPFTKPDSFFVSLPVSTVGTVVDWLDQRIGADEHPFEPALRSVAVVSRPEDPVEVRTTLLRTSSGIACWETSPVGRAVTRTLAPQATANDIRTGPGRLWVEAARDLAPYGVRTVRHDRRGVGESGVVDAVDDYSPIHSQAAVDDAGEVMALLGGAGTPAIYAGVCSGGWVAARMGGRDPGRSRVILVNHLMWRQRTRPFSRSDLEGLGVAVESSAGAGTRRPWRHLAQPLVSAALPFWAWVALGQTNLAQVPHLLLRDLAHLGLDTRLVFSAADHELFERQRGGQSLQWLDRRLGWRPAVTVTPAGDHAALHWRVRQAVVEACRDALDVEPALVVAAG